MNEHKGLHPPPLTTAVHMQHAMHGEQAHQWPAFSALHSAAEGAEGIADALHEMAALQPMGHTLETARVKTKVGRAVLNVDLNLAASQVHAWRARAMDDGPKACTSCCISRRRLTEVD